MSLRSCKRLTARLGLRVVLPVMFPPGCCQSFTRPMATGSPMTIATTGTVPVAACVAFAAGDPATGMTGRMRKRNKGLLQPHPLQPNVILHHRVAAGIIVFGPQPLENPLGRVPLLPRCAAVRHQDRVDHWHQWPQLRLLRWFTPLITRRNRKPTHLGDRVPAQPEHACRLPPAVPFNQHIPANRPIDLHLKHLQPSPSDPEKDSFSSGRLLRRRHAAALCRRPVADYSSAAYKRPRIA